ICLSCQGGRTPCLWNRPSRSVAKRGHLRRSHSSWYKTCGLTGTAADQIRAGNQSQDREGAGSRRAADAPWPRRRGDRVMNRRAFITLLGGMAAWPLAARAQQAGKLPSIGFVGSDASAWRPWTAAFAARLHDLGWIEDRTIAIEYRWSAGRPDRVAEFVAEFLRLKVDLIVTNDNAAPAVKQATSVIPIVFVLGNDPVGTGLVTSLARPGGNITGLSVQTTDLAGKRLELLRDVVPQLRRVAIIANVGNPSPVRETREVQAAAGALGLEVVLLEIRHAE